MSNFKKVIILSRGNPQNLNFLLSVTMEWWTDLWLNEGFATYTEYIGSNHVYPESDILGTSLTFKTDSYLEHICLSIILIFSPSDFFEFISNLR